MIGTRRALLWVALAIPAALMIQRLASGEALAMDLYHPSGEMAVRLMILALLPGPLADALGDWSAGGALVRADLVDHCYTGWRGRAVIARADGDVVLTAEGARALHVYVPPRKDFFCAEPVTAMPDAVNRGEAATLAPGERMAIGMRIGS